MTSAPGQPSQAAQRRAKPHASTRGAADRVRRSHAQTRSTLRLALCFLGASALAAAWPGHRWLALHLLLAGGFVTAISAGTLMLTVTWSAAPAPPDRWVAVQRWCVVLGAAGLAVGRNAGLPVAVVGVSGSVYVLGLLTLGLLLARTIRRGTERRFDAAVGAYMCAITAGIAGSGLGLTMALGTPSPSLRGAHVTANLLGLVGLTIGATLPFFAATVVRARMAKRTTARRLVVTFGWQVCMVAAGVAALAADAASSAAAALCGYAVGIVAVGVWMPPPTRRQLAWAGPRLVALWAGCAWWCTALVATAVDTAAGRTAFGGRWLLVLAISAYGQIVWGSLAYLLPMLRGGGHERLSEGFATTRSWPGLLAANVAGFAMAGSYMPVAAAAIAVWVLDGAARAIRVGTTRAPRPDEQPPNSEE
ncbi:MAG: hypothetical protein R2698_09375 [Microthrixaceae bacterium]